MRDGAAEQEDRVREVDGYALTVEPHGAGRYPVLLTSAEFSIQLTASEHIPTAFVQLRSAFLHAEDGPEAAFARSVAVVGRLCGRDVTDPHTSRLETIRVGTSPMVLRLYRKDIELRTKPGFADVFWAGYAR